MPSLHQLKTLPYSVQDLSSLVLNVESYPEFLPWCGAARVISNMGKEILAELVIEFKGFNGQYQSKICHKTLLEDSYIIEVEAISGPFEYLKNTWLFTKKPNGTEIEFSIDFHMKSGLLNKLIGAFYISASEKIIDAFEKRASVIYQPTEISKKINV